MGHPSVQPRSRPIATHILTETSHCSGNLDYLPAIQLLIMEAQTAINERRQVPRNRRKTRSMLISTWLLNWQIDCALTNN